MPASPEPPTRLDLLMADAVRIARSHKLSRRALAAEAGLHHNTLLRFGRDGFKPSFVTMRKLVRALDAREAAGSGAKAARPSRRRSAA